MHRWRLRWRISLWASARHLRRRGADPSYPAGAAAGGRPGGACLVSGLRGKHLCVHSGHRLAHPRAAGRGHGRSGLRPRSMHSPARAVGRRPRNHARACARRPVLWRPKVLGARRTPMVVDARFAARGHPGRARAVQTVALTGCPRPSQSRHHRRRDSSGGSPASRRAQLADNRTRLRAPGTYQEPARRPCPGSVL